MREWLALVVYVTGLILAFGWRTLRQWRRTGDTGLRLDAGSPGSVRWWAKVLFLVALALGFAGPVAGLAGLAPLGALDHPAVRGVGLLLAVVGVLATLAAQVAMGASWRIGVDPTECTDLVTTGAFAVARNPIFTAMAVTSIGLAMLVPNVLSLVATATLVLAVPVDRLERLLVGIEICGVTDAVAASRQVVLSNQRHRRRQVRPGSPPKNDRPPVAKRHRGGKVHAVILDDPAGRTRDSTALRAGRAALPRVGRMARFCPR